MCGVYLSEELIPLAAQVIDLFLVDLEEFLDPGKFRFQPRQLYPYLVVNGVAGVSGVSRVVGRVSAIGGVG